MVWPAAHIMVKYLERKYHSIGLKGMRALDIGSGTGITGLAAAVLGANVVLTDQQQLIPLLEMNTLDAVNSGVVEERLVTVKRYDWGANASELFTESMPFDLLLVSDCVLPKLYPIDLLLSVSNGLVSARTPVKPLRPISTCRQWTQSWGAILLLCFPTSTVHSPTTILDRSLSLLLLLPSRFPGLLTDDITLRCCRSSFASRATEALKFGWSR